MGDGPSRDSSAELSSVLERARAGSAAAFEGVYEELASTVAGYLRFNGVTEVDEMTNEVFAHVHRGLARFKGDWVGFRSWVFTIAHHRIVDERRRSRRRPVVISSDVSIEPSAGDVEAEAMDALSDEHLLRVLTRLSADQRDVLLLRIVADLPLEEVAQALGKSVGAVKSLQHRALGALRRQLEQQRAGRDT